MNIEEIVRTSMDQLVRDLDPPLPDPAAVRARVVRHKRIKSWTAVGLAAAVAIGIVVGSAVLRDNNGDRGPTEPDKINGISANVNALWIADGVLHLGESSYPQAKAITTGLVPVKNGAVYGAANGEIIFQPREGEAVVLQTDGEAAPAGGPEPLGPVADPDSSTVAILRWSSADGRYDLFLVDAARDEQIGTGTPLGDEEMAIPGDPNPFGESLLAPIDWVGPGRKNGSIILLRDDGDLWRWEVQPNGSASGIPLGQAPLDATLRVYAVATPVGGLTFTTPRGATLSTVDGVGPDGGLSHDGALFAGLSSAADHSGDVAVVNTRTGDVRYIEPREGTSAADLSWSRGHTLMFRARTLESPTTGFIAACDADTLACEYDEVDNINETVLPHP